MVVEGPEILSGTPVIKGTRVPVYDIAAAIDSGTPMDRILKSYPSLKTGRLRSRGSMPKQFLRAEAQSRSHLSAEIEG